MLIQVCTYLFWELIKIGEEWGIAALCTNNFINSMHVTQLCKEILGNKSFDKGVSGNWWKVFWKGEGGSTHRNS